MANPMPWRLSHRFSAASRALADRHYNRQTPTWPQFVPPGRCLVLLAEGPALWVTSWPVYAQHAWRGAWVNTLFRREGGPVASGLITAAVAATRWRWPAIPDLGMVTSLTPARFAPRATRAGATSGPDSHSRVAYRQGSSPSRCSQSRCLNPAPHKGHNWSWGAANHDPAVGRRTPRSFSKIFSGGAVEPEGGLVLRGV